MEVEGCRYPSNRTFSNGTSTSTTTTTVTDTDTTIIIVIIKPRPRPKEEIDRHPDPVPTTHKTTKEVGRATTPAVFPPMDDKRWDPRDFKPILVLHRRRRRNNTDNTDNNDNFPSDSDTSPLDVVPLAPRRSYPIARANNATSLNLPPIIAGRRPVLDTDTSTTDALVIVIIIRIPSSSSSTGAIAPPTAVADRGSHTRAITSIGICACPSLTDPTGGSGVRLNFASNRTMWAMWHRHSYIPG